MLSPRVQAVTVRFTVDGTPYAVEVFSDETALRALQEHVGRPRFPSSCESGLCGTCESLVDGQPTRLCLLAAPRLDGLTVVTTQPT